MSGLEKELAELERTDPAVGEAAKKYEQVRDDIIFGAEVGKRAFVVWNRPLGKKGERHEVSGFAQVRIKGIRGSRYIVEVLQGSGVAEGVTRDFSREELYCTREERNYFGKLVAWLIEGKENPGERPARRTP